MNPVGFTFLADTYCPDCAAALPDRDPEGNRKGAFFGFEESDAPCACGKCGAFIPTALTDYGLRFVAEKVAEADPFAPLPPAVAEWAEEWRLARPVARAVAVRDALESIPTAIVRGFDYPLTPGQRLALARLAVRWDADPVDLIRTAYPEAGNLATACLMVPHPRAGLVVGIEKDGYCHS